MFGVLLVSLSLTSSPEVDAELKQKTALDEVLNAEGQRLDWDEEKLISVVQDLFAPCLTATHKCEKESPTEADRAFKKQAEAVIGLLGHRGTRRSYPLLWKLDARGVFAAEQARIQIYERNAMELGRRASCGPPSAKDVEDVKQTLDDFAVVRAKAGALFIEKPTATELDELAYFLAVIGGDSAASLSSAFIETKASPPEFVQDLPKAHAIREDLHQRLKKAKLQGDLNEAQAVARKYLASLGFPSEIRGTEEGFTSWGGKRFSYVMRDLADLDEGAGNYEEAALLYRSANPGGGGCITGVDGVARDQLKGLMRVEEAMGNCQSWVVRRLFGRVPKYGLAREVYGIERLAAAQFDIARIYRGALVTVFRDIGAEKLKALFENSPPELGQKALFRLNRLGPENWLERSHGIEHWATIGKKASIAGLLKMALESPPSEPEKASSVKLTAINTLRKLLHQRACSSSHGNEFSVVFMDSASSFSDDATVEPLETVSDKERAQWVRQLLPLLGDEDARVREAAAEMFGSMRADSALPRLRRLLKDSMRLAENCGAIPSVDAQCMLYGSVQKAAQGAIDDILTCQTPSGRVLRIR